MSETLIPFALHVATGKLVEVGEVPRGMACGCVCPGCNTPLVARHCDERIDHFAHKTRNSYQETKQECYYSFFVSVRSMCKQILSEVSSEIVLPEYRICSELERWNSERPPHPSLSIDPISYALPSVQLQISPEIIDIECNINECIFDVATKDRSLLIYFIHEGRSEPSITDQHKTSNILLINLNGMESALRVKDKQVSLRERLISLIFDLDTHKQWLYRRNQEEARKRLNTLVARAKVAKEREWFDPSIIEQEHYHNLTKEQAEQKAAELRMENELAADFRQMLQQRTGTSEQTGGVRYACVACKGYEFTSTTACPTCPQCGSHLYARVVDSNPKQMPTPIRKYNYKDWP